MQIKCWYWDRKSEQKNEKTAFWKLRHLQK